jgi:Ca2+-binding RTX toxin-like protein
MALRVKAGGYKNDVLFNTSVDLIRGMDGDDTMLDAGRYGQTAVDYMYGDRGNDDLRGRWGIDILVGGLGHDFLTSRSDAGEPQIAQDRSLPKFNAAEALAASGDSLMGGLGADTFLFRLDLNARPEIIAKHTDMAGIIDWEGVAGENGAPHLHWVEGIGTDTIRDFYRNEGDKIAIEGHTASATIEYADSDKDGRNDLSIIRLKSDQGGAGSHDGDLLGVIKVYGDLVTMDDLMVNAAVHHGYQDNIDDDFPWTDETATAGNDVLRTTDLNGKLSGGAGDDYILDGGKMGDADKDTFSGGDGNDTIRSHWGSDVLIGGAGDDILVSRSDAGETAIAQRTTAKKYEPGEPFLSANDTMTGGLGADTFYFRLDLDAREYIVAKHSEPDGHIHWHDVAGENGSPHLHWVEGIGTDKIMDFYKAEGDKIVIEGHTVELYRLEYIDTNRDGRTDASVLTLRSNQGGAGSHHGDILGRIVVYGDKVEWWDVMVNSGPTYGVASTLDDYAIL